MSQYRITTNNPGHIIASIEDNVCDVLYSEYFKSFHAHSIATVILDLIEQQLGPCRYPSVLNNIKEIADSIADERISEARRMAIPDQIKYILQEGDLKKKDQVSLLKGVSLQTEQLCAIFLYAEDLGYLFSNIRFEGEPKPYSPENVPSFIRILDDGSIEHSGETTLTEGQLKSIVTQSQYIVARFLTKKDVWHCFIQTRHGIMGNESGRMGSSPHIHYFSNAFGYDLEDVKKAIHNGSYPNTPVHLPLTDYPASNPEN